MLWAFRPDWEYSAARRRTFHVSRLTGSGLKCRTLLVFISRFSTSASPGTGPMGSVLFTPEWVMACRGQTATQWPQPMQYCSAAPSRESKPQKRVRKQAFSHKWQWMHLSWSMVSFMAVWIGIPASIERQGVFDK